MYVKCEKKCKAFDTEPGSPESVVSEAQSSVSTVMEDLDSIFDEVISTASPPSSPPAAQHQNEGPFFQTTNPTFDDIQPTLQQVYQGQCTILLFVLN